MIEGYRDPNMKVQKPHNTEGILLKRRNWPMKGWHKRYFILADGILSYGKSKSDVNPLFLMINIKTISVGSCTLGRRPRGKLRACALGKVQFGCGYTHPGAPIPGVKWMRVHVPRVGCTPIGCICQL